MLRCIISRLFRDFTHKRLCYSSQNPNKILAIRREEQSVWERRAPLSANQVKRLCQQGIKVIVQPCNRRIFTNESYRNAGAVIQEDIGEASVIIGIKEVSVDYLLPHKTYCFFSHVTKGFEPNMPMLERVLSDNIRLIDYEFLVDSEGRKVPKVAFSRYAGIAGFINILHGLGVRLLSLGHNTPFLHVGLAHNYRRTYQALQAVREAGYEIALGHIPKSIRPIVFIILGTGSVSKGTIQIFEELPYEYVGVKDLPQVYDKGSMNKVYGAVVSTSDYLRRKGGGCYNKEEFREYPDRYFSNFAHAIAPYATVFINGLYWKPDYPKLLKTSDVKDLLVPRQKSEYDSRLGFPLPHRLLAICDISADPQGSFEFITENTSIDCPFFIYDSDQKKHGHVFSGPGALICSIDNMPTQLALEATESFGKLLLPYIDSIMSSDATKPLEEHDFHPSIRGAIITSNGKLLPEYEYLESYLKGIKRYGS